MQLYISQPYSSITETITLTSLTVNNAYGGVGGRYMEIDHAA
jgi:hypothetical protein